MDSWNDGSLDGIFAFSMGGDFVGNDCKLQIFWQTHEPGSDNTSRRHLLRGSWRPRSLPRIFGVCVGGADEFASATRQ
jgi:hypothetical protein